MTTEQKAPYTHVICEESERYGAPGCGEIVTKEAFADHRATAHPDASAVFESVRPICPFCLEPANSSGLDYARRVRVYSCDSAFEDPKHLFD